MVSAHLKEARKLLVESLRLMGFHAYEAQNPYTVYAWTLEIEMRLSFMPGNRRTLISHGVKVSEGFRGKGLGTKYCRMREIAARVAGVTLMLATVKDDNIPEVKIMEKRGWKRLTQNTVSKCSLWGKQL